MSETYNRISAAGKQISWLGLGGPAVADNLVDL